MLNLPSRYANWYYRDSVRWFPIIVISDGSTTWRFSTKDMRFTDGSESVSSGDPVNPKLPVYPLILDISPIRESIDFYTRRWSLTTLSVTLSNLHYKINTYGERIRFSDEINNNFTSENATIELYYLCGEDAVVASEVTLDNCLLVFRGRIYEFPSYTLDKITINAYAKLQYDLEHKELPNHSYDDITSGAGTYRPPIIYGDYSEAVNIWHHSSPLIKIKKGTFSGVDKYYLADHLLTGSPNIFWYLSELDTYMLIDSSYITINSDANRQYITLNTSAGYVDGYVFLSPEGPASKLFTGASNESVYNNGANLYFEDHPGINAYDRIDSTEAYAKGASTNTRQMSSFMWKNYGEGIDETEFAVRYNIDSNNVYLLWKASLNTTDYTYDYAAAPYASCVVIENKNSSVRFVNYNSDIYDGSLKTNSFSVEGGQFDFDSHVGWKMSDNEFIVRLLTNITSGSSGEFVRLKINELMLKVRIRYTIPEGVDFHPDYLYIETAGQSVNSDIASRSGLSSGALLEPAVYQIEMILRNHFDFTDAEIDKDSFDYAYGIGHRYPGRFVFGDDNRIGAIEFLQELCENGQIALYISPAGKAKIVLQNRYHLAPSSYPTIGKGDFIKNPLIEVTPIDKIVNQLTFNYDFSIFTGEPLTATRAHPDSIAKWGKISLENIDYKYSPDPDPPLDYNPMSDNSHYLFAIPRVIINFETPGIKYLMLEIGDYIKPESGFLSELGIYPGSAFVIFEKNIKNNSISFRALEINASTYDPQFP